MQYMGIVIHHSACSAINGKGFDFMIFSNGSIIPSQTPTDPDFIHICLEGDFSDPLYGQRPEAKEQLFLLQKLALRLSETLQIPQGEVYSHTDNCPGPHFPWSQLVISEKDRYH